MRDVLEKGVDNVKYEFWYLPPELSLRVLTKLTKAVGMFVGEATGGIKSTGKEFSILDAQLDMSVIGKAISGFATRLDENEIVDIVKTMLKYVNIQTEKGGYVGVNFDVTFLGKTQHMLKVVMASIEYNYKDFFAGLGGLSGFVETLKAKFTTPAQ